MFSFLLNTKWIKQYYKHKYNVPVINLLNLVLNIHTV